MYIITKSKTTGGHRGHYMTRERAKEMEKERASLVNSLNMTHPVSVDGRFFVKPPQDKEAVRKKIRDLEHNLATKTPPKLEGRDKDAAWARAKQLVDEIRVGMPTKFEMHPLHLNIATGELTRNDEVQNKAVTKHIKWEQRNGDKVRELKDLSKMLDHPELGNIERIRPKGGGNG